jgi:hypothetical protein
MTHARTFTPVVGEPVVLTKYSRAKDRNIFIVANVVKVSATRFTAERGDVKLAFHLSKYNGWQQVVEGGRQNRSVWSSHDEWDISSAEDKAASEARYAGQDRTRLTARLALEQAETLVEQLRRLAQHPQNLDDERKQALRALVAELNVKVESL